MALGGYEKNSGKRSGGIRSISMIAATDVLDVDLESTSQICTGVVTKPGKEFANYEFKEGQASFTEEMSVSSGVIRVRHEINFTIERPDGDSAKAAMRLAKASADGVVAIVTTNNNVSFLVGYSLRFGTEQPLRLSKTTLSTGEKHMDDTKEAITLVSQDACKAMIYTGNNTL